MGHMELPLKPLLPAPHIHRGPSGEDTMGIGQISVSSGGLADRDGAITVRADCDSAITVLPTQDSFESESVRPSHARTIALRTLRLLADTDEDAYVKKAAA